MVEKVQGIRNKDEAIAIAYALAEQGILAGNRTPDYGAHMKYALRHRAEINRDARRANGLRKEAALRLKGLLDQTVKPKRIGQGLMQTLNRLIRK